MDKLQQLNDIRLIGTLETDYGPADMLWGYYPYGGSPFVLLQLQDGHELTVLSVNLVDQSWILRENEFFVKTWSENEEFIPLALATDLFEETVRYGRIGYVVAPIWRLINQ